MEMPASLLLLVHIGGLPLPTHQPELAHRQRIAAGLLDTLVAADHLGLVPAQTTSAGVLLARVGRPAAPAQVLAQARHLFEAFHSWLIDFQLLCPCRCPACRAVPGLTLRVLAHTGPLAFAAGPAPRQPVGAGVAVLHTLLASHVPAPEHVLLTHALLGPERWAASWASAHRGRLGPIGYVCMCLRDAADVPALARVAGPLPFRPHWTNHLPGLSDRLALN